MSVKIYTKKGDDGVSGLINGIRKSKDDSAFEVLGTIDELNACLGLLYLSRKAALIKTVKDIQTDLFRLGALLAGFKSPKKDLDWLEQKVADIEAAIDALETKNKPLKNFILPGGTYEAVHLHYARTICRRLERKTVYFARKSRSSSLKTVLKYLNRLSDYLFVLARYYNNKGQKDVIWVSK